MATPVTVVSPSREGAAPAVAVAADTVEGNSVPNSRGLHLVVENTDAAPHTVTFTTPVTAGGYAVTDPVVSVPAGAIRHLSGFDQAVFGNPIEFTADSATVMIAAYKTP